MNMPFLSKIETTILLIKDEN